MSKIKNTLRITGGEYRSRRLHFIPEAGLRPTTDYIRETVFNWLQGQIHGYKILDLFAGSGVLGIEALSYGAAQVMFVDRNQIAVQRLRNNIRKLGVDPKRVQVFHSDAFSWLKSNKAYFDLIFLDPPFSDDLIPELFGQLHNFSCLEKLQWIYLEQAKNKDWPTLPESWDWYRQKISGQVKFSLLHKCTENKD